MRIKFSKKKILATVIFLTTCFYGQVLAEKVIERDFEIAAGHVKTISVINEGLNIKSNKISLEKDSVLKLKGNYVLFTGKNGSIGKGTVDVNTDIAGRGAVDINTDNLYFGEGKYNINANLVRIKVQSDENYWHRIEAANGSGKLYINQDDEYKKAITQIEADEIHIANCDTKINFYGKESYLRGRIFAENNKNSANLIFENGAQWIISHRTNASERSDMCNIKSLTLSDGSMIDFNNRDSNHTDLQILGNFDGSGGIIKMSIDGSRKDDFQILDTGHPNYGRHGDHISADAHQGKTTLILTNRSNDTAHIVDKVVATIKNEQGMFQGAKAEGTLSWTDYQLKAKKWDEVQGLPIGEKGLDYTYWVIDKFTKKYAPTTSTSTILSSVAASYDTWRNDTDVLRERMGELRLNGAGSEGVWVRTKGSEFGRHGGNGSYTNKMNTYQLGYDVVTSKDEKQTTYAGVAAEYGKGNASLEHGSGATKNMGLGVYRTQLRESGHYLDLVYKFQKVKNDFCVTDTGKRSISGKYGNNALSLSAEYGRKNELKHGWYVEPQSEVMLGYMFGNNFTTSNDIRVEQKDMPALICRLGLNVGREVSDKVNFYMKAGINHDFLGNYDLQMVDMKTSERLNISGGFDSSWFEYGVGLIVKTGKDCYTYFDIERAVGGEYKKQWEWNAGVRWTF